MSLRLSKSQLDKFQDCARCFWLKHRFGVDQPDMISSKVWKGIERMTTAHYETHRIAKTTPPNLIGQVPKGAIPYQGGEKLIDLKSLRYWGKGLAFKINEILVTTALDDMLQWEGTEGKTHYNCVDYKSKSKLTDEESTADLYQNQADVFDLAMNVNGFPTDGRVFFDYWSPNTVYSAEPPPAVGEPGTTAQEWQSQVVILRADHENVKRLVLAAAACLDSAMPEPNIVHSIVTRGVNKGKEKLDGCPICIYTYEREAALAAMKAVPA